jgi:hypothetical protein
VSRKPAPSAPPDRVEAHDRLVTAVPEVERKGAAMPYTSVNGNMFSYLDDTDRLLPWFSASLGYAQSLKPKPTTRRA